MEKIVSLAKRRGFVYPGSEIYGGLVSTYDYGPAGSELMRNIQNLWWEQFVHRREDMRGLETNILMSPKVWEASGHTQNFADSLVDCRSCQHRTRADHLIEGFFEKHLQEEKVEGRSLAELDEIIKSNQIPCPNCGKSNWTQARKFNQLFSTSIGIVPESQSLVYLRGEIAQGMFVNFKNVVDSSRVTLPFGLAQVGKAFRNEITLGNFIHRTLQFNLAEFEYFFNPSTTDWNQLFEYWKGEMMAWLDVLGIKRESIRWREHTPEERSFYSSRTEDIEFNYPFGFKELYGIAYRSDYDLKNHTEKSGVDLSYTDPKSGEKFIPHVIEPTFGMDRTFLAVLLDAYTEEGERVYLRLKPKLAPYKVAVFPLVANKPELVQKARELYVQLQNTGLNCLWDDRGNIGKRYYSQDEIGTPWCVTIDYQTLEDGTVTVRDRDTAEQVRLPASQLDIVFAEKLK